MSIRPKQMARMGEFNLEEAVLDVLLEAQHEGECIGPAEISRRAGIFREPGHAMKGGNDYIVWGILGKLVKQGRVRKCAQNPAVPNMKDGWELTPAEFDARRDDIRPRRQ